MMKFDRTRFGPDRSDAQSINDPLGIPKGNALWWERACGALAIPLNKQVHIRFLGVSEVRAHAAKLDTVD